MTKRNLQILYYQLMVKTAMTPILFQIILTISFTSVASKLVKKLPSSKMLYDLGSDKLFFCLLYQLICRIKKETVKN
jgi:hypothetical protein